MQQGSSTRSPARFSSVNGYSDGGRVPSGKVLATEPSPTSAPREPLGPPNAVKSTEAGRLVCEMSRWAREREEPSAVRRLSEPSSSAAPSDPSPICPGTSTLVWMPTPSGLLLTFTLVNVQLDVLQKEGGREEVNGGQ